MKPMTSPVSPDTVYRQQSGLYSPIAPAAPKPEFFKSPTLSVARSRTDPITERLIAHRSTQAAKWEIYWRTPILMVASFIVGVCLALGQHFLYKWLHHRSEMDEEKKIRFVLYGRAFAYFSKVAFGGCVILVYRQRIWKTFRQRALSVMSIDQMFLATEDPSLFVNWETLSQAPVATAMALIIWLIPLATIIFSPGALSFGDYVDYTSVNVSVPNLDFSIESYNDWRVPVEALNGKQRKSLMFYNTTDKQATTPGWFDYYDQPSVDLQRISLMAAFSLSDKSLNRADARQVSCDGNFNCTYTTSFVGPGYKCEVLATSTEDNGKLRELGAPFNINDLIPIGKNVYHAEVNEGEFARPQAEKLGDGGAPTGNVPSDFGVFKSEPVLWVGYSVNSTEKLPEDSPFTDHWTHRFDPTIFRCVHYETTYTVKWNYTEPFFTTDVTHDFIAPIIDTNFSRRANGSLDIANPEPVENFVDPRVDLPRYRKVAAYHALGQSLRKFLDGRVELQPPIPGPPFPRVVSQVTQTRLVDGGSLPLEKLDEQITSFYTDMILSLFSTPEMLAVSNSTVTVHKSAYKSTFIYNPDKLWGCYAPVIGLVFIILLVGAWTIWQDGTTFSVGFSRIMVTTRNSTLDDISRGACLGNDPFPMELMHTKLQFGVLNDYAEIEYMGAEGLQGVGHCAFGVPSELSEIRKGVPYAGLRRRPQGRVTEKEISD